MGEIKKMAFAGSWYPSDPAECRQSIETFIAEKNGPERGSFMGGIVPHAGWYFSGSIACRVIASLKAEVPVDLVVMFGGHMHPGDDPILLTHGNIQTPFGILPVAEDLVEKVADSVPMIKRGARSFPDENTLELQYPFVHHFFPQAHLFCCCVPPNQSAVKIGQVVCRAAKDLNLNTIFIGSTDMTHYGPNYGMVNVGTGKQAIEWVKNENDRKAIEALVKMDGTSIMDQGLKNHNMCCSGAAAATAAACKENGAVKGMEFDYATSFEKSAGSSFVGYSGILYA